MGGSGPAEPAGSGLCVGSWSHFLQGDPSHGKCILGGWDRSQEEAERVPVLAAPHGAPRVTARSHVPPLNCAWCWREGGRGLSLGRVGSGSRHLRKGRRRTARASCRGPRGLDPSALRLVMEVTIVLACLVALGVLAEGLALGLAT